MSIPGPPISSSGGCILLKLIPGRPKDLLDAEAVIARHADHLDRGYLDQWARWSADLMEDFRVPNTLKRLLARPRQGPQMSH